MYIYMYIYIYVYYLYVYLERERERARKSERARASKSALFLNAKDPPGFASILQGEGGVSAGGLWPDEGPRYIQTTGNVGSVSSPLTYSDSI